MPSPHRIVLFLLISVLFALPAFAQLPGTPDTTFGQNGEVLFQPALPNGGTPSHRNSLLQADGKIVSLMRYGSVVPGILARLNPDGSLDASFGSGGYAYLSVSGFALTKQIVGGEERFVVAGPVACGRNTCMRIERYTSAGAFDTTFGSGGATTLSATGPYGFATQPGDQKIVMSDRGGVVRRLNADGTVDTSFGTKGVSSVSGISLVNGIAVMPSGRILVCGSYSKGSSDFAIARLNVNGSLDDGGRSDSTPGDLFGTGGRALTDFGGGDDNAYSAAIDPQGRIVASGRGQMGGSGYTFENAVLVRYSPDGRIDTSFGTGGKAWLDIGGRQDIFRTMAFQSDGKIVATGEGRFAGSSAADLLTARFNQNGTIDNSFGNGGWLMRDMYGYYDTASSIFVQADPGCSGCDKIIVVGDGGTTTTTSQAVALRYYP